MPKEKHRPCPFCGYSKLYLCAVTKDLEILGMKYRVQCKRCVSFGPPFKTMESAWEAWDKRVES